MNTDLGDDPDGDLEGYDGGYSPVYCTCPPSPGFGSKISCPKCGGRYEGNGPKYEFTCQPILNAFGAETDTRATLYRDGAKVRSKRFFFKRRAVNQCLEWKALYGATPK